MGKLGVRFKRVMKNIKTDFRQYHLLSFGFNKTNDHTTT